MVYIFSFFHCLYLHRLNIVTIVTVGTPFFIWFLNSCSNKKLNKLNSDIKSKLLDKQTLSQYRTHSAREYKNHVYKRQIAAIQDFWIFFLTVYNKYQPVAFRIANIKINDVESFIKTPEEISGLLKYLLSSDNDNISENLNSVLRKDFENLQIWLPRQIWQSYEALGYVNSYIFSRLSQIQNPLLSQIFSPDQAYDLAVDKLKSMQINIKQEKDKGGILEMYLCIKESMLNTLRSNLYEKNESYNISLAAEKVIPQPADLPSALFYRDGK